MQDWKMHDQIWGKVRRWKVEHYKMLHSVDVPIETRHKSSQGTFFPTFFKHDHFPFFVIKPASFPVVTAGLAGLSEN